MSISQMGDTHNSAKDRENFALSNSNTHLAGKAVGFMLLIHSIDSFYCL